MCIDETLDSGYEDTAGNWRARNSAGDKTKGNSFHSFPRLPPEIRGIFWELSATEKRHIYLLHKKIYQQPHAYASIEHRSIHRGNITWDQRCERGHLKGVNPQYNSIDIYDESFCCSNIITCPRLSSPSQWISGE